MKTKTCDMFLEKADALVLTTNGTIKKNGEAVMGRGNALEAIQRWYGLTKLMGKLLRSKGNKVRVLTKNDAPLPYLRLPRKNGYINVAAPWHVIAFPVKHEWHEQADIKLIKTSCKQLKKLLDKKEWSRVLLPLPGCGNGGLDWKTEVRPIIRKYFGDDDRIVIVRKEE